jgi:hypothetical protein
MWVGWASCGGFPGFYLTLAGSRPGGRPSFLLYDKKEGKETYPAVAPPSGVPSFRVRQAGSAQTRPTGSNMRSPFSACRTLQSARQRGEEMQVINGQCPTQVPQGLGVSEKPVPTPPSSAPAGGAFRRGCLSPKGEFRAGRLMGAAQGSRPKGVAGSPFLPSYMDASRVASKFLSFGSADSLRSYIRPVGAVRTLVRCGP